MSPAIPVVLGTLIAIIGIFCVPKVWLLMIAGGLFSIALLLTIYVTTFGLFPTSVELCYEYDTY
jgi:hypothetical protein